MTVKVLIVDDEVMICKSLQAGLTDIGYEAAAVQNARDAVKKAVSFKPHIVLTDMRLGNEDGIALIDELKQVDSEMEIIVMTAYSDIASAVLAIKKGAFDYLNKPFELEEIKLVLDRAFQHYRLRNKLLILEKQSQSHMEKIIGQSETMRDLFSTINILSQNDNVTVLIRGETGTGKELVADAIHHQSMRKDSPILKINCSTLPAQLVESELFGFERSAFTGADARKKGLMEIANGGTVFLDELGELPLEMQAKLLRFLEEKKFRRIGGLEDVEVDLRIIAATNKNLEQAVKEKTFREDLYYRLNVVPVVVPPLRQRGEDILLLAGYFLEKYNLAFKKSIKGFDLQAKSKLLSYHWPGNIRELKNIIERIVILHHGPWITASHFPSEIQCYDGDGHDPWIAAERDGFSGHLPVAKEDLLMNEGFSLDHWLDYLEKEYLMEALEQSGGNQTRAAELLGISRFALKRRMEKFELV